MVRSHANAESLLTSTCTAIDNFMDIIFILSSSRLLKRASLITYSQNEQQKPNLFSRYCMWQSSFQLSTLKQGSKLTSFSRRRLCSCPFNAFGTNLQNVKKGRPVFVSIIIQCKLSPSKPRRGFKKAQCAHWKVMTYQFFPNVVRNDIYQSKETALCQ